MYSCVYWDMMRCRFRALILTVLRRSQRNCMNISMNVYMYICIVCVYAFVCVLGDGVVPLQSTHLDSATQIAMRVHEYFSVCMYVCMYVYIYSMCVCIYVCAGRRCIAASEC